MLPAPNSDAAKAKGEINRVLSMASFAIGFMTKAEQINMGIESIPEWMSIDLFAVESGVKMRRRMDEQHRQLELEKAHTAAIHGFAKAHAEMVGRRHAKRCCCEECRCRTSI